MDAEEWNIPEIRTIIESKEKVEKYACCRKNTIENVDKKITALPRKPNSALEQFLKS